DSCVQGRWDTCAGESARHRVCAERSVPIQPQPYLPGVFAPAAGASTTRQQPHDGDDAGTRRRRDGAGGDPARRALPRTAFPLGVLSPQGINSPLAVGGDPKNRRRTMAEATRGSGLRTIFSFFLGLMLTAFVGVGVYTFHPPPDQFDEQIRNLGRREQAIREARAPNELTIADRDSLRAIERRRNELTDAALAARKPWGRSTR